MRIQVYIQVHPMSEYGERGYRMTRGANLLREDMRLIVEDIEWVRIYALGGERGGSDSNHIRICNRDGHDLIEIHIPI